MLALTLALACQWLEPRPDRVHEGELVRIVVMDAAGVGVRGVEVRGGLPGSEGDVLGVTGEDGGLPCHPKVAGTWRLQAVLGGVTLSSPLTVFDATARRWRTMASLCAALAVAITTVWSLRRRARGRRAA